MDGAMFDDKCTVLPIWVRDRLFNIEERFPHRSKKNIEAQTSIIITHKGGKKTSHIAYVTTLSRKEGPVMRLQFGNDVKEWLKVAFSKTYHRNEERKVRGMNGSTIEKLVPFWEFIDIEWDAEEENFHFQAWYSLEEDTIQNDNKVSFHTDCGHSVKVDKVKKIGGVMEGKFYAKISGPKINSKSGIKTIYFDKKEDANSIVNNFLQTLNTSDNHQLIERKDAKISYREKLKKSNLMDDFEFWD